MHADAFKQPYLCTDATGVLELELEKLFPGDIQRAMQKRQGKGCLWLGLAICLIVWGGIAYWKYG